MAKPLSIKVILLQDFANNKAGESIDLSPDLGQRLIDRGIAERYTGEEQTQPLKETIVKTPKSKRK